MSYISQFLRYHQESNPEKFNEDFIFLKQKESILKYFDAICKSVEVLEGYTYLGSEIEDLNAIYQFEENKENIVDIEKSNLQLIKLNFRIQKDDRDEYISKSVYFPKLIKRGMYFIINDNRYDIIYQLFDSGTYRTPKSLSLKTLLMPIKLKKVKRVLYDYFGTKHTVMSLELDLFSKNLPFFIYYFSKWGYDKTMEFFGISEDDIGFIDTKELNDYSKEDLEDYIIFKITNSFSLIIGKKFWNNKNNQLIASTLIDCFNSKTSFSRIFQQKYWAKKLGRMFTTNNSNIETKGNSVLISFERALDEWTIQILRIPKEDKKDSYHMVRYMVQHYNELIKYDIMDLSNKRIRAYEYLIYGLLTKLSKGVIRILNSKNVTFERLRSVINNIKPGEIVKYIVNSELIRYNNAVNSINLFTSSLKFTMSGPQSPFNGDNIATEHRGIHPSYIGKIALVATSNNNPGISGTFVPFLELPENVNLHFTTEPNQKIKKISA